VLAFARLGRAYHASLRPASTGARRSIVACWALLLVLSPSHRASATSFSDRLGGTAKTQPIGVALSRAIVRSLPLTSASAGIARSWDDTLGTFTIDKYLFGQVFLERPETIGRGNWSFLTSYQWVHLDSLDGRSLDELRDVRPPICGPTPCRLTPYTIPAYHIDLTTNEISMGATYGVTDAMELNVTLPLLVSDLGTRIAIHDLGTPGAFLDVGSRDRATGVGDLVLRAKYQLLARGPLLLAVGLGLGIPTGDEDNFQGTGSVQVSPMLYASTDRLGEHLGFVLRPYFNAGSDLDADDVARSEVRWGLGLDLRRGARFTAAVAFLARHVLEAFGPSGALDVFRCTGSQMRCLQPNPPQGVSPLLGIGGGRRDLYDLTLGFRAAFLGRRLIATASCLVPLNGQGIRPAVIPLVGIEIPFVKAPPAVL